MARPPARTYTQTNQVQDRAAKQSLVSLWDRLQALEAQIETLEAARVTDARTIRDLTGRLEDAETGITTLSSLPLAGDPGTGGIPGGGGSGGGGGAPGSGTWNDGGQGAAGIADAGANGHVAPGTPLTAYTVGLIIGGVVNEFPTLMAPAVDQPTRDANLAEYLNRLIWHLQLAGFTAGNSRNPSGLISGDKVAFMIDGILRGYDLFSSYPAPFASPQGYQAVPLDMTGAGLQPNGGTPD